MISAIGRTLLLAAAIGVAAAAIARADTAPTPTGDIAGVTEQKTIFGTALADMRGMTLYTFDGDTNAGQSACVAACAESWRPFIAPRVAKPIGDWVAFARADGSRQWAYKGKPVYTSLGDQAAGEVSGDGADGRWHALMRMRKFQPPGVAVRNTELGPTFVNAQGMTLYMVVQYRWNPAANNTPRHNGPSPGVAACAGDCAHTWLPLPASADAQAAGDWSIVTRDGGVRQWAWKGHPLYSYAEDTKPGDALGEGNHVLLDGVTGYFWEAANLL
jgi:predicted lipoprotein with Yx(FWY)xxD motif